METQQITVDPNEVAKFGSHGRGMVGSEREILLPHMLKSVPLDYIIDQISAEFDRDRKGTRLPFEGLRILDIGCGGGLLCEPMARLGSRGCGVDAAARKYSRGANPCRAIGSH